ncbi:MAG: TonB C-terminal domain-containing protein [Bdellovibrionales bacterium]|nr:TonB C-terminal domain-containing protein [Bdellovibrionales bacterium]
MLTKLKNTVFLFVFVSLFIHTVFYTGLDLYSHIFKNQNKADKKEAIEIQVIETSADKKMQVVEQDSKQLNNDIDENAKYLGRHNQKVLQETRAQHTGQFSNAAQPGMRVKGTPKATQQKTPQKKLTGNLPTLEKLKPQFSITPKAHQTEVNQAGLNSQTSDHLKDVKKGLQTLLSTREFVYYSYYQRIREKIRQQWEPRIRDKVQKVLASGRSIASARDRVTQVIIILDRNGTLENVQIVGQSGVSDLDDAAVDAFKAAEPFPNPPNGIVENDGKIRIRWDFILEAKSLPKSAPRKQFADSGEFEP